MCFVKAGEILDFQERPRMVR